MIIIIILNSIPTTLRQSSSINFIRHRIHDFIIIRAYILTLSLFSLLNKLIIV